ncbi:MAG TPA: hypothetical protein VJM15_03435 [Sphingomicrobium sp.]|nr:hypothetical protein [Sphingomicrobium sp.]
MPSPTQHFKDLGAPLRNPRWSWGAEGESGSIILRAWRDEIEPINGRDHIRLTNNAVYNASPHPGWRERLRHIQQLREGAVGYVVVCTAQKRTKSNRRLKSFDHEHLYRVIRVVDLSGDQWAELGEAVPIEQYTANE